MLVETIIAVAAVVAFGVVSTSEPGATRPSALRTARGCVVAIVCILAVVTWRSAGSGGTVSPLHWIAYFGILIGAPCHVTSRVSRHWRTATPPVRHGRLKVLAIALAAMPVAFLPALAVMLAVYMATGGAI